MAKPKNARHNYDVKLTQEIIRELLNYDPETGILTWRQRDRQWFDSDRAWKGWNTRYANQPAGCLNCSGYIIICLLGINNQKAHRD